MEALSAPEILKLKRSDARALFGSDPNTVSRNFKLLAKKWHPDLNPGADSSVFPHIVMLHEAAKIVSRSFPGNEKIVTSIGGKSFRLSFLTEHKTDFGHVLTGKRKIFHIIARDCADLADHARLFVPKFANDAMEREFLRFLPKPVNFVELKDGFLFVEEKTEDQVLLSDLVKLAPLDPKHVAWMATRLVNIAAWLEWNGIAHGAIGPESLLVSPEFHSVALTGPFMVWEKFGEAFRALPSRTLDICPRYAIDGVSADSRVDLELVKAALREVLGDINGSSFAFDPDFPKPFANWLMLPSSRGAREEFTTWENVRDASFGPPRFVKWDISPIDVMMV